MTDSEKHEVMDVDQLEAIRRRSQSGNSGPWITDTDEMRKKTVFKRASKWIPIAPEVYQAIRQEAVEAVPRMEISVEPRTIGDLMNRSPARLETARASTQSELVVEPQSAVDVT
jgi:recombinational DNA repair protein RecT